MKKLLFGCAFIAVLLTGKGFANEQVEQVGPTGSIGSDALFYPLGVDPMSVQLKPGSEEKIADGFYKVTLTFLIRPSDSCQENYAGVLSMGKNQFTTLYATTANARCEKFAQFRTVEQTLNVNLKASVALKLNGIVYTLSETQEGLKLRR